MSHTLALNEKRLVKMQQCYKRTDFEIFGAKEKKGREDELKDCISV